MNPDLTLLSVLHAPAFGGSHNQSLQLAPLLERRGISTVVALPEEGERAAARLRDGGVRTPTLPLGRLVASADPRRQARFLGALPGDLRRLGEVVGEVGADVVQVQGITHPQGAVVARRRGAGVVWQLYDTRAPMALRRAGAPLLIGLADVAITWGRELARVHPGAERLGDRCITVYPPVERKRFAPDPQARAGARSRLGVGDGETLVGSVGVLNPQKGYEDLIEAARLVCEHDPTVRFVICGGPSPAHPGYADRLRRLAADGGLEGAVEVIDPGTEVAALMQAFDVFAMASVPRSEGMPTVILEAMYAAKPVLTTRVGAVAELVDEGRTALVVEPRRPDRFAEALRRLCTEDALAERLAAAGLERARSHFGLEPLADRHAAAYRLAHERSLGRR
ncbi:MAG: glycosyltransferase family 4 protein [Solirubrobacterales bacterium]